MIALVSAKGSPGVTVSALALALSWPGRCLLAECDPAGGDVLAGYLGGALDARRGLAELAVAELRERLREEFERQLVDLDAPRRERLLLPGLRDPAQSATVAPVWHAIADHLRATGKEGYDIIVDCGRLAAPHFGWPLLAAADLVLLVVRGTLPSVSHALPAVTLLRRTLATSGGGPAGTVPRPVIGTGSGAGLGNGSGTGSAAAYRGAYPGGSGGVDNGVGNSLGNGLHTGLEPGPARERVGLLVVDTGPYSPDDVARRLRVGMVARLPYDQGSARALTFGGPVHRRRPLLRTASTVGPRLLHAQQEVADAV